MGETKVKQINIKSRTYYFYNGITDLKKFELNLLKIDKKSCKNIDIYYIGYITIKKFDDYKSICSVNPLCLHINHASGYMEEKNGNKYLFFNSVDENKEVLKNTQRLGMKLKNDHGKDCMKIKFNSDYDLPLNKPLKFHAMTIIIRSVFEEGGKFYPQLFLDGTLYELV